VGAHTVRPRAIARKHRGAKRDERFGAAAPAGSSPGRAAGYLWRKALAVEPGGAPPLGTSLTWTASSR